MAVVAKWDRGEKTYSPVNKMIGSWTFKEEDVLEAELADALANLAEQNGIGVNDLMHTFPFILRAMKSKSGWAG